MALMNKRIPRAVLRKLDTDSIPETRRHDPANNTPTGSYPDTSLTFQRTLLCLAFWHSFRSMMHPATSESTTPCIVNIFAWRARLCTLVCFTY